MSKKILICVAVLLMIFVGVYAYLSSEEPIVDSSTKIGWVQLGQEPIQTDLDDGTKKEILKLLEGHSVKKTFALRGSYVILPEMIQISVSNGKHVNLNLVFGPSIFASDGSSLLFKITEAEELYDELTVLLMKDNK